MSLRDTIQAADDSSYEDVDVPEWGVTIRVVPPSVGARADLLAKFPEDGEGIDYKAMFTNVLIATCYDPDTNEPAFTDADAPMLLEKNGAVVQRLFEKCQKAAGFNADEVVERGKDGSP